MTTQSRMTHWDYLLWKEAEASVALSRDSRAQTVAGVECGQCWLLYNMELDECPHCGAAKEAEDAEATEER